MEAKRELGRWALLSQFPGAGERTRGPQAPPQLLSSSAPSYRRIVGLVLAPGPTGVHKPSDVTEAKPSKITLRLPRSAPFYEVSACLARSRAHEAWQGRLVPFLSTVLAGNSMGGTCLSNVGDLELGLWTPGPGHTRRIRILSKMAPAEPSLAAHLQGTTRDGKK